MVGMKTRIISIDDFGISAKTNEASSALVQAGVIDRVAVMPHGSISSDEVRLLLDSGVALDVHLDRHPVIRDDRALHGGFLGRIGAFVAGHLTGRLSADTVRETWEEQILAFRDRFGRLPDGLNSHEHVHFFPPYFDVLVALAKKYRIPHVRFGRRCSGILRPVAIVLDILRFLDRKRFVSSGLDSSDVLVSADWIPGLDIVRHAGSLPADTSVEYIFHPERDEEFSYLTTIYRP